MPMKPRYCEMTSNRDEHSFIHDLSVVSAKRRRNPNFRLLPQSVKLFYVAQPCCAHCRHGENIRRKVYCTKLIGATREGIVTRKQCAVAWHGICDNYRPKRKGQRT